MKQFLDYVWKLYTFLALFERRLYFGQCVFVPFLSDVALSGIPNLVLCVNTKMSVEGILCISMFKQPVHIVNYDRTLKVFGCSFFRSI